jgi:hypothetical protein
MKLRIVQDEDAPNPRTEFDCFGKIVHWHRRYDFGERINHVQDWIDGLPDGTLRLPIALLDHSGLRMWVGSENHQCDPGGWDSGQVGFIYATPDMIRKEYGEFNAETVAQATKVLRQEVETFDQYLSGDVWGFIVEDDNGNHLDSCWGFFGHDYAKQQGEEALRYATEHSFDPAI